MGKDNGELENCDDCRRIQHHDNGNEIDTLSSLYEYCTTHQSEKVAYLHNKGSFHATVENARLRIMLNKAVFSEECLLLKTPTNALKNKCNICSSRFSPIPHHHVSLLFVAVLTYLY